MREVRQNWRDLFLGFRIALDLRKMFIGLVALLTTLIVGAVTFALLMAATIDEQNAKAANAEATVTSHQQRQRAELSAEIVELEREHETADPARRIFVHEQIDAKREQLRLLDAQVQMQAMSEPFIDNPDRLNFFSILGGALFSSGNATAELLLEKSARLTLADVGIGTFRHPTLDVPYVPSGLTVAKAALFFVAGIVLWYFLSRQLGAISRIAAVEIARDVRLELPKALEFAKQKAPSLFWAPLAMLGFFALLFAAIWLWGLFGNIPILGPIVNVLTSPAVLLAAFLMAVIAIGGTLGFPLLVPAIAVEGTDMFEALSRAFSYVFSRVWHYLFYTLVGLVYGAISIAFVWGFTLLMLGLAAWPARMAWGTNFERFLAFIAPAEYLAIIPGGPDTPIDQPMNIGEFSQDGAMLIFVFVTLLALIFVIGMALAYAVSYLNTMYTMIYFLLRYRVDGTDVSEIFYDDDDDFWIAPPVATEPTLAATATPAAPAAAPPQSTATAVSEEPAQTASAPSEVPPAAVSEARHEPAPEVKKPESPTETKAESKAEAVAVPTPKAEAKPVERWQAAPMAAPGENAPAQIISSDFIAATPATPTTAPSASDPSAAAPAATETSASPPSDANHPKPTGKPASAHAAESGAEGKKKKKNKRR